MTSTYFTETSGNTVKSLLLAKDELHLCLMTGRDTRETALAIAERFNVGQNDARDVFRTESAFFHNQMELLSYEEKQTEKYIFAAPSYKCTSLICQRSMTQVYMIGTRLSMAKIVRLCTLGRSTTVGYTMSAQITKS